MLSRVAEAYYWIGRYVERAASMARFADVERYLELDLPGAGADYWTPLVLAAGDPGAFHARYVQADAASVLRFLAIDTEHANSIWACLRAARENARVIRDSIPVEVWRRLHSAFTVAEAALNDNTPLDFRFFDDIKQAALQFTGLMHDTAARHEGWQFWHLGQQLERADQTTRLLDVKYFLLLPSVNDVGSPLDELQWAALLKCASADEPYRARHGRCSPERIVEFLLLDRDFPRAVHACLVAADEALHAISGSPLGTFHNAPERRLGQLRAQFAFTHAADIVLGGFHEFIDACQAEMNALDRELAEAYLSLQHAQRAGPLTLQIHAQQGQ